MNRRRFIDSVIRGGLFTGLVAGSYYLLNRDQSTTRECRFSFVCQDCKRNSICKLPEASRFRFSLKQQEQNG